MTESICVEKDLLKEALSRIQQLIKIEKSIGWVELNRRVDELYLSEGSMGIIENLEEMLNDYIQNGSRCDGND
ncbi:hypothetical protein [Leptospira noguchii]|uniref:Uncharacterized protein n=2 Tax=Leptospira noguchii TaxID=28182 RepID=M6U2L1_9LEPT|nr:hypothetical protein [Leptospira noguchii]EMO38735.1 hypothetical protein LEP1GSC186_3192 [Leptospira noguchii serovar Autumnalis str. ZUN142]